MKVNTLIIGAARSATTSLSQVLDQHPDICLSRPKEPQFFSDENWREKINAYHNCFTKESKILLDASTNYSKYPSFNKNIHKDIYEYNEHMKLIYIMRHPIDRMISHYKFSLERGLTEDPLEKAFKNNLIYLDASRYLTQIESYLKYFPKQQMLLINFDDFQNSPEAILERVSQFLEIDPCSFDLSKSHLNKTNAGDIGHIKFDETPNLLSKLKKLWHYIRRKLYPVQSKTQLSSDFREELLLKFKDDIPKLEVLLDQDLSSWKE